MNKSIPLTALLFLAGPTLLSGGAESAGSPEEQELALEVQAAVAGIVQELEAAALEIGPLWLKLEAQAALVQTQALEAATRGQEARDRIRNAGLVVTADFLIQEVLQRKVSKRISESVVNHYSLNGDDVAALSSTAISTMIGVMISENPPGFANGSKDLGGRLVGKYVGRKFVTASICAINWCSRKVSDNDLINAAEHQDSIKLVQKVTGLIGSATGGMIITSVVNSNSNKAENEHKNKQPKKIKK